MNDFRYRGRRVQLIHQYDWKKVCRILDGEKERIVEAVDLTPYVSPKERWDKITSDRLARVESAVLSALKEQPTIAHVARSLHVCWTTAKKYVRELKRAGKIKYENGKTLVVEPLTPPSA